MQKNNLCPISNKILTYEESDSFSQSNFNENKLPFGPSKKKAEQIKQKYFSNISTKINQIHNNYININKNISKEIHSNNYNKKINKRKSLYEIFKVSYNYLKTKYKIPFELNYYIYSFNYFYTKYNNEYLERYFSYSDSIQIMPTREFYFYHHMLFLERPNFANSYFNKVKKNTCLKKLDIYQNQRKKELKLDQINNNKNSNNNIEIENENKKIFDTNVLETIENYSTTMTQEPNNEKQKALTPLEIFKLCEDKNYKNKIVHKNNDQKSIITFSESEISHKSKNIVDESMISVIKELSEKPNKFKIYKQEKKYTNLFIKKKDIQKFGKYNNNINKNNKNNTKNKNKNNHNNYINEEKDITNKKKVSTSTNKKAKKINFDEIYHNTISKSSSKRTSFINNAFSNKTEENKKSNFTSFGTTVRKNKGVLNLKKESYKLKNHYTLFSDNYPMNDNSNLNNNINSLNSINSINNINSNTNSKLVSTSFNNIDKLLNFFLTPNNKNNNNNSQHKYEEFNFFNFKKRQMKKKTTLTIVNNTLVNKSQNSKEKYNKITKYTNCKSKSPLSRLILKKKEYKSNDKKNNVYKKKKSILTCEIEHNSQIAKSVNKLYLEKKSNINKRTINEKKNISSNNIYHNIFNKKNKHLNIMTLNQDNGTNRRNSYQFMKLKKNSAKSNLNK